ncbi:cysteine-rich CWC family protein [Pseudomonas sp. GD03842]|uniref:cysteine-rich CWC family protein n=1 Tax=Pseudomonas sp. GD03842 TaxID=2975385 RepID=UPI00244C168E|nr:cysteine-rich CWC family protein [Pseudomonas sp. GD03842]MDH0748523.1 cysteine-rich CWC family protein [Pseudomonas sp. GD03842]
MSASEITPDTCPVCGQRNHCTLADPRTADRACWCFTETLDPAVLANLPDDVRGQSCLCPRCAGLVEEVKPSGP